MPGDTPFTSVADKQSQLNRSTQGQWQLYSSHRQELERLLVPKQIGGRICVLGAGNCNDLDLAWLTKVFSRVHLVDIDADAPTNGIQFQKIADASRTRITVHGNFDLTGVATRLSSWGKNLPTDGEITAVLQQSNETIGPQAQSLGGPFDVVLSPCVLSQLLTPLRDTIGENHRQFTPLLDAMRSRHFRLMSALLSPGGRGVFACDLLSSKSYADLARVRKEHVADVMGTMLSRGKFFSGLDPASILAVLRRFRSLRDITLQPPWLWHLGLSRTYLVYAVMFSTLDLQL